MIQCVMIADIMSTLTKSKLGMLWQAYSADTTHEEAWHAFIVRYARRPWAIWRNGGGIHAGPITKAEHDGKLAGSGAV